MDYEAERVYRKLIRNQEQEINFLRDMLWKMANGHPFTVTHVQVKVPTIPQEQPGPTVTDGFLRELLA